MWNNISDRKNLVLEDLFRVKNDIPLFIALNGKPLDSQKI